MMKKQYIIPITERVFPEALMDGFNPGGGDPDRGFKGGGVLSCSGGLPAGDIICAPGR